MAALLGFVPAGQAAAQDLAAADTRQPLAMVKAPPGFTRSCARYSWLCSDRHYTLTRIRGAHLLQMARRVNAEVNRSITPLTDPENYGVAEYWTLPGNGSGDCEDYALEKYRRLIEAGVDSRDIRLAVGLDRRRQNHLVLLLRHETGDLVLDNLTSDILPWNETGYEFLAIQHESDTARWQVVMGSDRREAMLAGR